MSEENTQHNSECKSEEHDQHLCYIISQGFHLSNEQELKNLTDNPEFKCNHCGRKANSDKNLCVPFKL